ncbi:hypothetical protein [Butyrivibrio sp. VCB2001]|uniref:hypothetical protein n=1 Tax=Butyrivibrio sp. VCB2001 TaxID=1280667 RepID=UPI00047D47FE|nr:hypothetical protein [Butyrivibrio sp. VCB2001]
MLNRSEILCDNLTDSFLEADRGRKVWIKMKEEYAITSIDSLLIFPEDDPELCISAINLLDKYIAKKKYSRAFVICENGLYQQELQRYVKKTEYCFVPLSQEDFSCLLRYYRLVQFFANIVVVSCNKPYGSRGLIESGKVTVEDYIENTLYV